MDTAGANEIILVDSDKHLGRLLQLRLNLKDVQIRHLSPSDFNEKPTPCPYPECRGTIIISWPHPGYSPRILRSRIMEAFPGLPVIDLIPDGQHSTFIVPDTTGPRHCFSKPLVEIDKFLSLIESFLNGVPTPPVPAIVGPTPGN